MRPLRPVVVLEGGLGNQLFQYAYGQTLGAAPVVLDNRRRRTWGEPLTAVLKPSAWRPVSQTELLSAWQCPRTRRGQLTAQLFWHRAVGVRRFARVYAAADECGEPHVERMSGVVLLEGYFQDEKFVNSTREQFVGSLREELLQPHEDIIRRPEHVAISFRLAPDYEKFGLVLPDQYYAAALEHLVTGLENPVVHVCADDSQRARELLTVLRPGGIVVDHSQEGPVSQLRVMASAARLAISNSTFAWWGAWLGDTLHDPDRLVLCPDRWLAAKDSVPAARWQRIPSG